MADDFADPLIAVVLGLQVELDTFEDIDTVVAAWAGLVLGSIAVELEQHSVAVPMDKGQDFVLTKGRVTAP